MLYFITLIILFGTSSITANEELQCQQGWHKYNSNCYWFSNSSRTRDNATLECRLRESKLITVDTNTLNTFLQQYITGDSSYWIGLKMNNIATSAWRWNTGGPLVYNTLLTWCDAVNHPDTACAVMYYNPQPCVESFTCIEHRPFICDKEKTGPCPQNWKVYSDGTPRCYYTSTNKTTRMEAAKYCWDRGGRLVIVPSYLVKVHLAKIRSAIDNVHWIGLSPYRWDDGTPYNWNNWDENGPSIGDRCTRLLPDLKWKYGDCSTAMHHFICQKAASPSTTTTPTAEPSTASSTATTKVAIEDTTTSTTPSTAISTIISSSIRTSTRTALTSGITRIAEIPTTHTPNTKVNIQNVTTMSTYTEPDKTTVNDGKHGASGNSETTTIMHSENAVPVILYVLIVIYTAVGVTAIVFIGLLAKYISLRRGYETLNDEKPHEHEIDDFDFDDKHDHKLYENQEYVGVEQYKSITFDKVTAPQTVETDKVGSTGECDHVKAAVDEHSEQGEHINLYYNDPDCMTSLTNSEQVNIYDDPINVNMSESDARDA